MARTGAPGWISFLAKFVDGRDASAQNASAALEGCYSSAMSTGPARLTLVIVSLLALPPGDAARPRAQETRGVERAAELLSVDFTAVGADGSPIADLLAADVTIRINGKPRALRSLNFVSVAAAATADRAAGVIQLPPPFGTNDSTVAGRIFHLVIDDESFRTGRERALREAVDRFVTGLLPADRISLVTMPYGGVKVPLTVEHSRIRTAISTIIGHGTADESGSELACRSRRTLESLIGLIETFGVSEQPKTVIFVSAGLAAPRRDNLPMLAPGACELRSELFQQVGVTAGAARAQFYMVLPEDVMLRPGGRQSESIAGVGFTGSENPLEGLEHLAGVTGAHRMNLTGVPETALGRIARETAGYYVATFVPEGIDRAGRTQQLSVKTRRPNVTVRARPEITFAATAHQSATTVREMVLSGRPLRDFQLRASAYASREPAGEAVMVTTLIEPADPAAKIATLGVVLFDERNKAIAQWTGSGSDLKSVPVMAGMTVPAGFYRLRVGAIDDGGRGGTVDTEVAADLTPAGQLKLSSLLLGLSREAGFLPRMQFSSEPVAIAYVEIYGGLPGMAIIAALELATTLNGPAMVTVPLAVKFADNRYLATGAVPIGALPPGDYAVRAIVGVQGQPAGRVVRTLRKVAK
jgi:VWFA-related protein